MKIVFFTQEDPFYVKIFFDEFFTHFKSLDEIKAVVISNPMGKKSLIDLGRQMYGLYGPFNFFRVGFKYVFHKLRSKQKTCDSVKSSVCGNSKLTGVRKSAKSAESLPHHSLMATAGADLKRPKTHSVKQTVQAYGIEVIERNDLNTEGFHHLIREYEADLFISVASPIIFREELINTPKLDCINIHNAPLPKYRGMLPNFWQLYHGEKEAGMTVHRIETGIDTGDIITQHFVLIGPEDTLDSLIRRTKKENAKIIMDVIEDFRNGRIQYRKMEGEGSYFTFPSRKDVKELRLRGRKIM